jgi:hypothetical protein
MLDQPYFMTNEEWYKFDYDQRKYVLTDKADEKAKESYREWEKELRYLHERDKT